MKSINYEEIIINEYVEQFTKYMESEKQLIEMLESEDVNININQIYHIYDTAWINSWKKIISFKELIKEDTEDKKNVYEIIKKSLNSENLCNIKLGNKGIYKEEKGKYLIKPMKPFVIISDEVWKLFSKNTKTKNCDGKISLLKGNKKIIIPLNNVCYSIRFLSKKNSSNKKYINEYNEFIIEFISNSKKKQKTIIDEIANSNIDDWMKKIGFKFNAKQFPIKINEISFVIKQKYSNWNFKSIKKYRKTSNISAVMRALSTIEPLTDYFMNNINEQSELLNSFKEYFKKLWLNEEEIFMPKKFCESIRNLKDEDTFNIKEEQDPIKFLRLILDYLNENLNKKDNDLNFNFNNINKILSKLSKKPEYLNDLDKIIKESNSIIGKLFYGLMLEVYRCENCKKNIIEKIKKFDVIDIDYKGVMDKIREDSNSYAGDNLKEIDFYIKQDLKIDNKKHSKVKCNICQNDAEFKKEILAYPPFLLIRLNRGEVKGLYVDSQKFLNNYDKNTFMEGILSDIIKNHNQKNIEYELISMVNFTKIKDKTKNEEKIEFINISKSPFLIEDKIWISFICNRKPVELGDSYDNDISWPCILFYKLKEE